MQFLRQWLEVIPLTLTVTGLLAVGISPAVAQISNTASASADNLSEPVNSNEALLTAAQPRLELTKTADRAAAEPGDTVVYRLALKNTGEGSANDIRITDTLPLGFRFLPESLQGSLTTTTGTTTVNFDPATVSGRSVTFTFPRLKPDETLNVVYATLVTPDAVRGEARNNAQEPRSNVASHLLRLDPGILSDCGTLVGRVFVDKNFDGQQQPGEPGVPNAVIFLDDGNRVTTDANGLFSLANVLAGRRSGTLDLTSVPGYTFAPNRKFIESNSQSRLVQLEPGGLARMNFAVTPAYREGQR